MSKVIKKSQNKTASEKQEIIIHELIEVFSGIGYSVRTEKGLFKGGFCLLKEQKLFLLNRNIEPSKKISFLARNLALLGTENIFVKPEIRDIIDKESPNTLI
ncbi:MAG: hypothetical protein NTV87_09345 [Ignavibacteriae bacterium]|jgi:hypothetical protein|nr:hypothetical protein [Ignavibacteriota bacterium]